MKRDILDLETRREIYNLILKSPLLHTREISRKLDIPFSTLEYHLRYLEKRGLIRKQSDGRYIRYYVTFKIGIREKKILSLLRQNIPRIIVLYLLALIYSSQREISVNLGRHPTTVEFHLKKLMDLDVIEYVDVVDGKIYRDSKPYVLVCSFPSNEKVFVLKDWQGIYDLLITYRHSLIDDIICSFIMDYVDYVVSEGMPDEIGSPNSVIDSIIEVFLDIFPNPYCV